MYTQPYVNPYAYSYGQQHQHYNDLLNRLNEIERRQGYGNQTQQHQVNPQSNSSPAVAPQPVSQGNTQHFIPVSSEKEAWEHEIDASGKKVKQLFYCENTGEVFAKLFDANIPKTFRWKGVLTPVESAEISEAPEATQEQTSATEGVLDGLSELTESVDGLTGKVDSLIEFIKTNPFSFLNDTKPKESKPKAKKEKE